MNDLIIKRKANNFDIPEIFFNYKTGACEIAGESYPENATEFYRPIIEWLSEYMFALHKPIQLNFKLYYFNTTSSKPLYDLLMLLKQYQDKGGQISINWYYEEWDIDLFEEVEDFGISTELKINLIPLKKGELLKNEF
jgi:hypothetical protein